MPWGRRKGKANAGGGGGGGGGGGERGAAAAEEAERRFAALLPAGGGGQRVQIEAVAAEFGGDPLAARVLELFAGEEDPTTLSAEEFRRAASELRRAQSGSRDQRSDLLFRVYDGNEDGFVCPEDLAEVLSQTWGASVPREIAQGTALRMVSAFDIDRDGKLSGKEFRQLAAGSDLDGLLSLPL